MDIYVNSLNKLMKLKINFINTAVFKYETTQEKVTTRDRLINNMFYITSGYVIYMQGERQTLAEAGDIVWLPYGSSYNALFTSENAACIEGICLDFQMIDDAGNRIIPPQEIQVMAHDNDGIYKNMYTSAITKQLNSHSDFAFRAAVYNIFAHLFNDVNRFSDSDGSFSEINYAIQTIERSPQSNETIADLAANCGISETSLRNKFKLYTGGMGPVEYRNYLRVEKSKELLQIGHCSMEIIAETLGFYDASYFIKIFKRVTGHTPHEYRRSGNTDC